MVGGKALKLREWKARAGKVNRRQTELSWTVGDCPPPAPRCVLALGQRTGCMSVILSLAALWNPWGIFSNS